MKKKSRFSGRIPPVLKTCRNAANRANMVSADTYIKGAERTVRELTHRNMADRFFDKDANKICWERTLFSTKGHQEYIFLVVQSLSHVRLFVTHGLQHARLPCLHCLMSIKSVMPSNHLPSPSPPSFNLSQHQGLFQREGSSHQVVKVLEFPLQHQSFQ